MTNRKNMDSRSMDELRLSTAIEIAKNLTKAHGPHALALEIVAVYNKHTRLYREYLRHQEDAFASTADKIRAAYRATAALTVEECILLGLVYSEYLTDEADAQALATASDKARILCEAIGVDVYTLWLKVEHHLNGREEITN